MLVRIMMKNPDCVSDAIDEAARESAAAVEGLDDSEREALIESRVESIGEACGRWIEHGEYITVEIDTTAKTARVVPVKGG